MDAIAIQTNVGSAAVQIVIQIELFRAATSIPSASQNLTVSRKSKLILFSATAPVAYKRIVAATAFSIAV